MIFFPHPSNDGDLRPMALITNRTPSGCGTIDYANQTMIDNISDSSTIPAPEHSAPPVPEYDVVIAGGGLAGLALSIQLARAGYSVAVFEKETYPVHKVCGEYVSLESWNFLEELGLPLSDWSLPVIRQVLISAPDGNFIQQELPLAASASAGTSWMPRWHRSRRKPGLPCSRVPK